MVLPDLAPRGLVEVGVIAGDERAAAAADPDALDLPAAEQQLLQVDAGDAAARLGEDQPGVDTLERGQARRGA
jgi:hypothetical protein